MHHSQGNYSLNDLEKLLGLKDNFTKDDIIKKSDEYLKKYKNQKDNNLYNFFVKVREKLLVSVTRNILKTGRSLSTCFIKQRNGMECNWRLVT